MSSKKKFWRGISPVKCPDCEKYYKHRMRLIHHLARQHGCSWDEAKHKTDATGIYIPKTYRVEV